MRELTVELGERSYPIYIGQGVLNQIAALFDRAKLSRKSPLLVVTDDEVAPLHLERVMTLLREGGFAATACVVPAGEPSKSLAQLEGIVSDALRAGLDRSSAIVALGGGVVGDLAGFAAASFMRGIRFVQIPTTILAHDSSVGGKVAVNHPMAKNIIGAFHQPELVLFDIDTLMTLPPRQVKAGLSEVIKHGLIWDAAFTQWCDDNADKLLALDPEALGYALYVGCKVKSIVVSQDERENDLRAILNLGHTIGHALEAVAGYGELLHGEAISIGMVGAAKLAQQFGYSEDIYHVTKGLFLKFGLPVAIPAHLDTDSIMSAMMHDKKFKEGTMVYIVPVEIGKVEIRKDVTVEQVRQIVELLKGES
ncbi:3-dehydroquinate synthase [Paenibacillus sp. GCM10023248]|uniref:3-dehydroquinate synthase n=1 Tax=Bacillales TaxID=1385 RepID=UPI002379D62C|nr:MULTISPECIES: 3-dehydroquinate synthase [Bacillales]MDD9267645.1 3-dehydroquinate synthase [Paenibacillus sp. MAHUQ-63]MDR6884457.1 3-dehydroquinate synthase [Bacillus sp. 3255]